MKVARMLPPVGYRFPVGRLGRAACDVMASSHGREEFEGAIAGSLGMRHAFAVSSGKAALSVILRALRALTGRTKVILPAYTCYSVPSAIVHAGLELVPCDVAADSFDYDYERLLPLLQPDVLCVLSVHLFGIPADVPRLLDLCRPEGIFVVEDAAQALGSTRTGRAVGTLGDVGLYSLGRGKNVTCGSGGVIVTDAEPIAREIGLRLAGAANNGLSHNVRASLTLTMLSAFVSPAVYWFPAGLPFLKLGETIFDAAFPVRRLSAFEALLLRGWERDLTRMNAVRRANGAHYTAHIEGAIGSPIDAPYLRFPVVLDTEQARARVLDEQNGRALGISQMYPAPVDRIDALAGKVRGGPFARAERLARRLITLPTHPLLTDSDRARVCALVNMVRAERSTRAPLVSGSPVP